MMQTADPSLSVPPRSAPGTTRVWQRWLLWIGAPLCALGIVQHRLWEQWHPGRFGELLVLSLLAFAIGWPLGRFAQLSWASALAAVWLAALVLFADPLPVAALALFALAAVALGGMVAPGIPVALRCACGFALCAGVLGWLLPLPVHHRATYLLACFALIAWRHRALVATLRASRDAWQAAVAGAPRTSAVAVLALGLASTGCWLPTLQVDDLGYHLRLPWQLLEHGAYPLDPMHHVWALAPWGGDALHAVPQILAHAEARGPLNAAWLAIAASGLWALVRALDGSVRTAWWAVALFASLPLTAALAGGMQTELPTAAYLAWLVVLIVRARDTAPRSLWCGAILAGGLISLKLSAAAFVVLLLPWTLWHARWQPLRWLAAAGIAIALGASSYVYAGVVSGNPVLPLFNGWFHSPFVGPAHFDDPRWHAGFGAALPWDITFATSRYMEAHDGGIGFSLILLAGAMLLAFGQRRLLPGMLASTALLCLPLLPMQYARYAYPALALLMAFAAASALSVDARRGAWLLAAACLLNFAFQANAQWMLRTGALKTTVRDMGRDEALFLEYQPERVLLAKMRGSRLGSTGNVLLLDAETSSIAELGARGRVITVYAPRLRAQALAAQSDATGAAWSALLRRERIRHVVLRPSKATPAERAALKRLRASRVDGVEGVEWWRLPATSTTP